MNWISVKDRLPNFDISVLIYGEKIIDIAKLQSVQTSKEGRTETWAYHDRSYDELYITVTHWAELPEPPKTK